MRKKKAVLLGILFLVAVVVALVYTTMGQSRYRVEACMEFRGRTSCRIAGGATQNAALRAAVTNACADIASGVTDTIQCENGVPKSFIWLSQPTVTIGK